MSTRTHLHPASADSRHPHRARARDHGHYTRRSHPSSSQSGCRPASPTAHLRVPTMITTTAVFHTQGSARPAPPTERPRVRQLMAHHAPRLAHWVD
jgi:hypothetical protein